jgi:hypothetical protein
MKYFKNIASKILIWFSHSNENEIRFYAPMDVAVPPMEIDFIYFELSTELNDFYRLNNSYTNHGMR